MLAGHRIEFLHFQFFGHGALVLGSGVIVTGASTGYEFDLFTHDVVLLNLLTAGADIGQYGIDTFLVDDAHAFTGKTQLHEALFAFDPELVGVQVWQKPALGLVVCVGDVVTRHRTLSCHLTYS